MEKYEGTSKATDGDITRRMPLSCYINKATEVRTEYINFPQQKWLHESVSVFSFVRTLSPVLLLLTAYWKVLTGKCSKLFQSNVP